MTRPANRSTAPKDSTRERLLESALTVFSERGYEATSVRDILTLAGVTQPTLYHYFDGKLALFLELVRSRYADAQAELERSMERVAGCEARLRAILTSSIAECAADPRVPRLFFQAAYGPPVDGGAERLEELASRRFALVRRVVAEGVEAGRLRHESIDGLALAFCCLMDQHLHLLSRREDAQRHLTPALADWLLSLFLQGAQSHGG